MTSFVIDASIGVCFVLAGRATPDTDDLLTALVERGAAAPPFWPAEVASALLKAARRERLGDDAQRGEPERLSALAVRVALDRPTRADSLAAFDLAVTHRLSAHDAAYLELAGGRALPLATIDRALRTAALRERLAVLPAPA